MVQNVNVNLRLVGIDDFAANASRKEHGSFFSNHFSDWNPRNCLVAAHAVSFIRNDVSAGTQKSRNLSAAWQVKDESE